MDQSTTEDIIIACAGIGVGVIMGAAFHPVLASLVAIICFGVAAWLVMPWITGGKI